MHVGKGGSGINEEVRFILSANGTKVDRQKCEKLVGIGEVVDCIEFVQIKGENGYQLVKTDGQQCQPEKGVHGQLLAYGTAKNPLALIDAMASGSECPTVSANISTFPPDGQQKPS